MTTEYVPAQHGTDAEAGLPEVDFRSLAASHDKSAIPNRDPAHPSGGKRKRDQETEEDMAVDDGAAGAGGEGDVPATKRRAYDNVSGRKSGRPWKVQFGRASSLGARPPGNWDAKMREKAAKKETQERLAQMKAEAKEVVATEKKRRAEVKARREANRKAAQIVQKVTNPKKLAAMSKKQARKLVNV